MEDPGIPLVGAAQGRFAGYSGTDNSAYVGDNATSAGDTSANNMSGRRQDSQDSSTEKVSTCVTDRMQTSRSGSRPFAIKKNKTKKLSIFVIYLFFISHIHEVDDAGSEIKSKLRSCSVSFLIV